jgi:type I restriction enzyme M protein
MKIDSTTQNKFCCSTDLKNEASVESFFILRLLKELGYADKEIKTKQSIKDLNIGKGRTRGELYKFCPNWYIVTINKMYGID